MNNSNKIKAFLFLIFLFSNNARATFDFSPIVAEFSPTGSGSSVTFTLTNDAETKTPVQVYIVHRNPDIDGNEEYKESPDIDELFQIYPPQMILNAKERRSVRVSWVGNPKPKEEIAFRIIAEELPFSVDDNKTYSKAVAEVKLASKYVGSLYVIPQGAMPMLVAKASTEDGKEMLLDIENKGGAHKVLDGIKLTLVTIDGKISAEIPKDDVKKLFNQNILGGRKRRFTLPWPKSIPKGPVKVTFELPKE